MSIKPLFIPLKTEHWNNFVYGTKDTEYRLEGPRWNSKTCYEGRPVILSKGYGKKHRIRGTIYQTFRQLSPNVDFIKIYGRGKWARVIVLARNLVDRKKEQEKYPLGSME